MKSKPKARKAKKVVVIAERGGKVTRRVQLAPEDVADFIVKDARRSKS